MEWSIGRLATTIRRCYTRKDLSRAAVIGGLCLLDCLLGPSPGTAADALALGTQWLGQAQLTNGAWGDRLEVPATALASRALLAVSQDVAPDLARLRAVQPTEFLAHPRRRC